MKITEFLLASALTVLFCSCQGEKGERGDTGPTGNANVAYYSLTVNKSGFNLYGSSNVYGEAAPSSLPLINGDQAALVYIWMDPVDSYFEWVQQPFSHYFNSGNAFNEFFHGVDQGRLWLYIRNSSGGAPYSNMNSGTLSYKVFILQSTLLQQMDNDGVTASRFEEVLAYFDRQGIIVEAH